MKHFQPKRKKKLKCLTLQKNIHIAPQEISITSKQNGINCVAVNSSNLIDIPLNPWAPILSHKFTIKREKIENEYTLKVDNISFYKNNNDKITK